MSLILLTGRQMWRPSETRSNDAAARELARVRADLGRAIRDERHRRRLTQRDLGRLAGVDGSTVCCAESGRSASLEVYVRLAHALRLRPEFDLVDARSGRQLAARRPEDPVHAAVGEIEARRLRGLGFNVGIDEPYQHYQFAGRADVTGWAVDRAALLHLENRTAFPNVQEAAGSYNAKRAYLGFDAARRTGVERWSSETHVLVCLWTAEVLHAIRLHEATFASLCPDGIEWFETWWAGQPPSAGRHSVLVVFDPIEGERRSRWAGLSDLSSLRPRYRDYAEAAAALRSRGGP